jgi:GST-like protein
VRNDRAARRDGKLMIELFFFPSPNGLKAAIALAECALEYRLTRVNILRGEQFAPRFLAVSPNNKIPALIDHEATPPLAIFESGAILLYLAEKSGRFLPTALHARYEVLQWLFWQVGGLGPMAGQAHHFRAFASEQVPYGIKRYTDEVNRLYGVLERRLQDREYIAGDYSIADMAVWPWIGPHERQGQDLAQFPSIARWYETVARRPAVRAACALEPEASADEEARKFLYGQTARTLTDASRGE